MLVAESSCATPAAFRRVEPVVSFRDWQFDRVDLVLAGFILGTWQRFERAVVAGLACEREAGPGRDAVDVDEIRAAAIAFRRARGLVSGDELRAWLAERGLSRDDWTAYLRRSVLRERYAGILDTIVARHPVSVGEIAAVLDGEAACDGILRRCGTTVVEWSSAAHSLGLGTSTPGDTPGPERLATLAADLSASAAGRVLDLEPRDLHARLWRLLGLQAAHQRFVERVLADAAIRDCLDQHRLDWLRYHWVELRFSTDAAAREGAMCLREDGLEPAEVARLAGTFPREVAVLLQEAGPVLTSLLVAVCPGDVVGPLADETGGSRVLVVTERVPPSPDDPGLRERARQEVVAASLQVLTAGMVSWHGPL